MLRALLLVCLLAGCAPKVVAPASPMDAGIAASVEKLLLDEQWDRAGLLLQGPLMQNPDDLRALGLWDMVLHGQGRYMEAARVRKHLLEVWQRDMAAEWHAKGSPHQEASWARVVKKTARYRVVGSEFYAPPTRGKAPKQTRLIYEIAAFPFDGQGGARRFEVHEVRVKKRRYQWELRENRPRGEQKLVLGYRKRPSIELSVTDATIELATNAMDFGE